MSAARPEPEGRVQWREKLRPSAQMRRVMIIWLVLSLIATPLVVIVLGPHLPPGSASDAAHGQQQDNTVMTAIVTPIVIALLVYFIYALIAFRRPEGDTSDGDPTRGDVAIMAAWIGTTFVIVIFLAAWGAYELFPGETGAGGGQGPTPLAIAKPADASSALRVQVIGQQWAWTFRYPTYGGVESTELVLPVNRQIRFSVTSIDVVHSFWALPLGVKADAVPNTSNVAFAKPVRIESSVIRCAELCGLWHGQMYAPLHVVSASRFAAWIAEERRRSAPIKRYLPPYAPSYAPEPTYRAE
ncbi:MAG: cytochrome c oxidase subunit II [Solirubrobacteraceae bacterium]